MKKLGFGLMRLPTTDPANAGAVDLEQTKRMVDLFIEKGFTYFDTAWMYCGFQSEPAVKEALVSRHPRDSFTLATKLNAGFFDTLEGRDDIFNQQLEKTGAGYFDYYLLHGIDSGSYQKFEDLDCFRWLMDKKEQGLVRSPGFSFHGDAPLLDEILTKHPELEFVQLQINYLDWDSQWIQSRACYEAAVKHNKPVIVMEPVKGGTLAQVPAQVRSLFQARSPQASPASWAISSLPTGWSRCPYSPSPTMRMALSRAAIREVSSLENRVDITTVTAAMTREMVRRFCCRLYSSCPCTSSISRI